MKEEESVPLVFGNNKHQVYASSPGGVMACTWNPANLEAEFRKSMSSVPVGGNGPLINRWLYDHQKSSTGRRSNNEARF